MAKTIDEKIAELKDAIKKEQKPDLSKVKEYEYQIAVLKLNSKNGILNDPKAPSIEELENKIKLAKCPDYKKIKQYKYCIELLKLKKKFGISDEEYEFESVREI